MKKIINAYAKFYNKTITQVVKEAILEKIENEFDLNELNKAIEEYEKILYHIQVMKFGKC